MKCCGSDARRSTNNAPKPNTRFLKNIIKETDSHNAALKAKEAQESRARLRELGHSSRGSSRPSPREGRRREDDGHRSKRRRVDEINGILGGRASDHEKPRSDRDRDLRTQRHRHRRRCSEDGSDEEDDEERRSRKHRHGHHHSHRRRSRDKSEDDSRRERKERQFKPRRRSRSRSPREDSNHHRHRPTDRREETRSTSDPRSPSAKRFNGHTKDRNTRSPPKSPKASTPASDSDPLESLGLIGPKPPAPPPKIISRGRGTFASSSAMDAHFNSNYDPTVDVVPDVEEDDDWDQALEALKDRQKWQQNQAERMRTAGFTEEDIGKWEKGKGGGGLGGEGGEDDVKWRGRGEGREWDRGKVVGVDGGVETEVEWGRLKGT